MGKKEDDEVTERIKKEIEQTAKDAQDVIDAAKDANK